MTDQIWQLIPEVGIECGSVSILLDQERTELNTLMSANFLPPAKSQFADEDDFVSKDKSTLIRIRYSETQVQDIEFLKGILQYQGIDLHAKTTYSKLEKEFADINLTLEPTVWLGDGSDCPELYINVATHEDVGGSGDGIEWVILSKNFE